MTESGIDTWPDTNIGSGTDKDIGIESVTVTL